MSKSTELARRAYLTPTEQRTVAALKKEKAADAGSADPNAEAFEGTRTTSFGFEEANQIREELTRAR